jgi:GTP-binding protein Era
VREKLLRHTRAELPFSTAVVVDGFEEADEHGIMRLYCSILVERASQKRIVIGRHGALIKRIGTEAREDLERFFATKIYLDLHVRVRAGWREDERDEDLSRPPRSRPRWVEGGRTDPWSARVDARARLRRRGTTALHRFVVHSPAKV